MAENHDVPRVLPMAGVRYAAPSSELPRLISPPYDVIGPAEERQLRSLSPYNAIHLELPKEQDSEATDRYRAAADRLAKWRSEGVLRSDERPLYYLSETEFSHAGQTFRRRDLLAAVPVEPWSSGAVLPHEHTMSGPKADRLELLRATHFNFSPIWVLLRDRLDSLEQAWRDAQSRPRLVEFDWRDEHHRLWAVDDPTTLAAIQQDFARGGPLYIADGHHRYETALAFRAEAESTSPGAGAILAAVTWAEDPGLLALPTHRLVRGLDPSLTLEQAEARWSHLFEVAHHDVSPAAPAEEVDAFIQRLARSGRSRPTIGVYGLGRQDRFAILQLAGEVSPEALPADRSAAWRSLDVTLLHSVLVDPLVSATGRPRDRVLSYVREPRAAIEAVRQGHASVAFFLNPTPVSGVLEVADAHDRMPEKSTYFHPKPPAGLVMRDLDAAL